MLFNIGRSLRLQLLNRTIRHADLAMLCAAPLLRGISSIPMRISSEQAVLGHNSSRAMCTASESELRQVQFSCPAQ